LFFQFDFKQVAIVDDLGRLTPVHHTGYPNHIARPKRMHTAFTAASRFQPGAVIEENSESIRVLMEGWQLAVSHGGIQDPNMTILELHPVYVWRYFGWVQQVADRRSHAETGRKQQSTE